MDSAEVSEEIEVALQCLESSSDIDDTLNLLHELIHPGPSYIIIDGIDECSKSHRRELLAALSSLVYTNSGLRLFLCGRTGIQDEIETHFEQSCHIALECEHTSEDIKRYVEGIIDQKVQDGDLRVGDPSLVDEIKSTLAKGAQGMYVTPSYSPKSYHTTDKYCRFLWAFFQVEEISSQPCDDDIRIALQDLPRNLNEIFNRALRRILVGSHCKEAQKVFTWVAAARRSLTVRELREAIAVMASQKYSNTARQCNDMDKISSWCENLVETEEESESVHFVHHSVRTFLLKTSTDPALDKFHVDLEEADHKLGEVCLTYLDFNDFKRSLIKRPKALNINPSGIMRETAKYGSRLANLRNLAVRTGSEVFDLRRSVDPDGSATTTQISRAVIDEYPFIRYASKHWISHTKYLRINKFRARTVLQRIVSDNLSFVELPWNKDPLFRNDVMGWAKKNHHGSIIRILWSEELDNLFKWAAENDDFILFDILFDEVNYESPSKILIFAASVGHLRAIDELVLHRKVPVNDVAEGTTALIAGTCKGHIDIIEKLFDLGADINATNGTRRDSARSLREIETPLIAAARLGHLRAFDRLKSLGAYKDLATEDFTILIAAASGGHLDLVDWIISNGANLNETAGKHTALSKAAAEGHLGVVKTLLTAGADVNASVASNTALTRATEQGHVDVVDRLLAAGADDATTFSPALRRAMHNGDRVLYRRLLEHEVELSYKSRPQTLLHVAAMNEDMVLIDALVEAGVKVNAMNNAGATALHVAARFGYLDVVRTLRHVKGALAAQNREGESALHVAVKWGCKRVVEDLASTSLIFALDSQYRTAWDLARENDRGDLSDVIYKAQQARQASKVARQRLTPGMQ